MKINLKIVSKIPKLAKDNEVIFLKNKTNNSKTLKLFNNNIFTNKLFNEKNFLIKNVNNKNYIFVNCLKAKTSLEYEKLGS